MDRGEGLRNNGLLYLTWAEGPRGGCFDSSVWLLWYTSKWIKRGASAPPLRILHPWRTLPFIEVSWRDLKKYYAVLSTGSPTKQYMKSIRPIEAFLRYLAPMSTGIPRLNIYLPISHPWWGEDSGITTFTHLGTPFFNFFYQNDALETPNSSKVNILWIVLLEDT